MSKEWLFLAKSVSWVVTAGLCWIYAARGYSSTPRLDMWFWGVFVCLDLMIVGAALSTLASGR